MPVTGLSESERVALSNLMGAVIAVPGLDDETRRRARWLKLRLDGVDSLAEIDRRYAISPGAMVESWNYAPVAPGEIAPFARIYFPWQVVG